MFFFRPSYELKGCLSPRRLCASIVPHHNLTTVHMWIPVTAEAGGEEQIHIIIPCGPLAVSVRTLVPNSL